MVIALPNQDKSFTTTLFLPLTIFQKLTTVDELLAFFQQYFPDAISLIGRQNLIETYFSSKPLPLMSIKCSPHASPSGDILLMGDASHSMVPFYGQGMNSAFEDTLVLFDKLKQNQFILSKAFLAYEWVVFFPSFLSTIFILSATRVRDLHAVVDLSMYNYLEMSHLVTQRSFLWRKKLDSFLYRLIPKWWIPLYTMVTFTRIPYSKCIDFRQRQDRILKILRLIGYSIVGSYLFKQFALYVIKPFAIKLVAHRYLPTVVANQVVGEWEVFQINSNLAWTCDDDDDVIDRYVRS